MVRDAVFVTVMKDDDGREGGAKFTHRHKLSADLSPTRSFIRTRTSFLQPHPLTFFAQHSAFLPRNQATEEVDVYHGPSPSPPASILSPSLFLFNQVASTPL